MNEVFIINNIGYVLHQLETEGYWEEIWTMQNVRQRTGLRYQLIYCLERRGIIGKIERARNGRLIWMPSEIYEMLKKIKSYLSKRIKYHE
ncbi:MAG: hypothetical protein WC510_02010 [Candidatus Omnitrophota bacterium]